MSQSACAGADSFVLSRPTVHLLGRENDNLIQLIENPTFDWPMLESVVIGCSGLLQPTKNRFNLSFVRG